MNASWMDGNRAVPVGLASGGGRTVLSAAGMRRSDGYSAVSMGEIVLVLVAGGADARRANSRDQQ
jgi:hypothetical protein